MTWLMISSWRPRKESKPNTRCSTVAARRAPSGTAAGAAARDAGLARIAGVARVTGGGGHSGNPTGRDRQSLCFPARLRALSAPAPLAVGRCAPSLLSPLAGARPALASRGDRLVTIRESSARAHSSKATSTHAVCSRIRDVSQPRAARTAARPIAAAVAPIGIAIGAATALVQPHLSQPWSALVNSASPWLLGGFAAGALAARRRLAVAAGLAACAVMVAAYYVTAAAIEMPVARYLSAFWLACALVGGPVSGLAGWAWRRGTGRARAYGAAFPPGTFIAEAVGAYGFRLHYQPAAALFLLIGVALLCLLIRRVPPDGLPGLDGGLRRGRRARLRAAARRGRRHQFGRRQLRSVDEPVPGPVTVSDAPGSRLVEADGDHARQDQRAADELRAPSASGAAGSRRTAPRTRSRPSRRTTRTSAPAGAPPRCRSRTRSPPRPRRAPAPARSSWSARRTARRPTPRNAAASPGPRRRAAIAAAPTIIPPQVSTTGGRSAWPCAPAPRSAPRSRPHAPVRRVGPRRRRRLEEVHRHRHRRRQREQHADEAHAAAAGQVEHQREPAERGHPAADGQRPRPLPVPAHSQPTMSTIPRYSSMIEIPTGIRAIALK